MVDGLGGLGTDRDLERSSGNTVLVVDDRFLTYLYRPRSLLLTTKLTFMDVIN